MSTTAAEERASAEPPRTGGPGRPNSDPRVAITVAVLISLALLLRGWGLYRSWFYLDDFRLVEDASRAGIGADYLLAPYDSQFMPVGRLLSSIVADAGLMSWSTAATLTLGLQLVASLSCWWMLTTLVGTRWAIVPPILLYLGSTMTLTSFMWWAASLNALPLQVCFFAGIATWVRYLRGQGNRWLLLTVLVLLLGMASYVKALVLLPLLAALAVGFFSPGHGVARVRDAVQRWWPALVACGLLGATYLAYYVVSVPQLVVPASESEDIALPLAGTMLGRALPVGLVGGPWTWSRLNPPVGIVDPPEVMVGVAWAVLMALAVVLALLRRRTGRVWALLGGYALASYLLLLTTRAPVIGSIIGLEYRYLSDVTCAAALALVLLIAPLRPNEQGTVARSTRMRPLQRRAPAVGTLLTVLVAASSVFSTLRYVEIWHQENPGEDFLQRARSGLANGPYDVADEVVPSQVIPGNLFPFNTTSRLLPLVVDQVTFPEVSDDLVVIAPDGEPRRAALATVTTSRRGPDPGCGWKIDAPTTIPMVTDTVDFTWWVRVGYLSSAQGSVSIAAGDDVVSAEVREGLGTIFARVDGKVSEVGFSEVPPGLVLCVDSVDVGSLTPGGPL